MVRTYGVDVSFSHSSEIIMTCHILSALRGSLISAVMCLAVVFSGHSAAAQSDVLLTVSGDGIETTRFDFEALEALPATSFSTTTTWTDGVVAFTGVLLSDLLASFEVTDGTLKATAANDYSVEVPVSDAVPGGPIVAYMRDGAPMSLRDKGPLWLVYPYDSKTEYQSEVIYSRSIWQLDRIEVAP